MEFKKTPLALATFALFAAAPFAAHAVSVSFKEPLAGEVLSNVSYYNSNQCEVTGSDIKKVVFSIVSSSGQTTALNTELGSPWNCKLDSKNFSDGNYTLRAVAYDSANRTATANRAITIKNNTSTTTTTTTNPGPLVTITKPANGTTVSSGSIACAATASDSDGIQQLQWFVGTTLLNTELSSPYDACNLNASSLPDGTHTLKAVATDKKGNKGEAQITLTKGTTSTVSTTTNPGPSVTITKPASGTTISTGPVACAATASDSDGIKQVQWFLDGTLLNTELGAPYDTCNIDSGKFSDGTHTLKVVATDNAGVSGSAQVSVNIKNPPVVAIQSPAEGATLSGYVSACAATATDRDGVKQVQWLLDGTLLNTELSAPYDTCNIDTKAFADGVHTLKVVATDNLGSSGAAQVSINIKNRAEPKAVSTFHSLGLYWTPPATPADGACLVRYRAQGDSAWKDALPMWFDARNSECRGSIVHLAPGTAYEMEFSLAGQAPAAQLTASTWSETLPIANIVQVPSSTGALVITEGGSPSGYVLYTGPATIDAGDLVDHNVVISAPYVIVRGLTLKGATRDAISLRSGAENVVIEDNDISGWGRWSGQTSVDGWKVGVDGDAGISGNCYHTPGWLQRTVIQRNRIHHPRYGSSSWSGIQGVSDKHPRGPNAIFFNDCGGNHVLRYNEVYSDWGLYFNDGFGGFANHSNHGMPDSDSDIYGNIVRHVWDDAIESEGANMNVRIWGNYMDQTATGVATTSSVKGPVYIFRNVWNRSQHYSLLSNLDQDTRLYNFKSGSTSAGGGRRYVVHNTMLQAPPPAGSIYPLGGGGGLAGTSSSQPLTNTVSRNNIFHIWKSWWNAIYNDGGGNDLDYDMTNGGFQTQSGAELNGIIGTPTYEAGHGWESESGGLYQLAPWSAGYDRGMAVPNFSDGFTGAAPDIGAHEAGAPAMRFGVQ